VSQPRYAPRRARLKLSLTRAVTSAAALAALALVCGPVLESSGGSSTAQAAAISTPTAADDTSAAPTPAAGPWTGPLPIRPSRIAKAVAGSTSDAPVIKAAALGPPGPSGALGIPLMVLRAYHESADQLAVEQPSCKLPWWLLAGIGHTESGHAESGRLTADGTTRGRILGPRLNGGIPGDAVITDTDKGRYDGDKVYDRAVGPMQFIPSTWVRWGTDGNADGKVDPSNIFDATLAAGRYLCAGGRNLATPAGLKAAVLSYNHSAPYLATVLAWGMAYRSGASALPDSPLPVVSDVTKVRPPKSSRPPKPTTNPSKLPSTEPTPAPSSSSPAGSASASASPSGSSPASGSASVSASPSETPSCPSASPSPTDSESSSAGVASTTSQSLNGSAAAGTGSATGKASTAAKASAGAATPGRTDTASGTAGNRTTGTATSSTGTTSTGTSSTGTSSGSRAQSATAQSLTAQSSTAASGTGSATASPSASSCTP
jgi:membrane-bound lytic murein transglycosylase B